MKGGEGFNMKNLKYQQRSHHRDQYSHNNSMNDGDPSPVCEEKQLYSSSNNNANGFTDHVIGDDNHNPILEPRATDDSCERLMETSSVNDNNYNHHVNKKELGLVKKNSYYRKGDTIVRIICVLFLIAIANQARILINLGAGNIINTTSDALPTIGTTSSWSLDRWFQCKCVDCFEDELCGGLWTGLRYFGMPKDYMLPEKKIHIIVSLSHCSESLAWIDQYIHGFNVVSIDIGTKCEHAIQGAPDIAIIEVLPKNVGGCDHTYAHYITTILPKRLEKADGLKDDSIVVFLNDDFNEENRHQDGQRLNDFKSMVQTASSSNGFACGLVPLSFSVYHNKDALFSFSRNGHGRGGISEGNATFASNYSNVGDFYNFLVAEPLPNIVQVCHGGVFATSVEHIYRRDTSVFSKLEKVLSRGDNIAEEYYAERSWALLLARPLLPFQVKALLEYSTGFGNPVSKVQGALLHAQDPAITRPCAPGKNVSAALVLFGIPKSFESTWQSYFRNIVERNPHVDFEVHLHMYSDIDKVSTPRNQENNEAVEKIGSVHKILHTADIPAKIVTSSQKEFDNTLFSWMNKTDTLYDYDLASTMNIYRQGNSIKEAFLSASMQISLNTTSESYARCGHEMVYIFARSDTLLLSPIDIPQSGLGNAEVHVPRWHSWVTVTYNDRFALAGPMAAKVYAAAKSFGFKEMVIEQKKKPESPLSSLGTAERMLRVWLDKHDLNVTVVPNWARLLRLRGGGRIHARDAFTFGLKAEHVRDLSYQWTPMENFTKVSEW